MPDSGQHSSKHTEPASAHLSRKPNVRPPPPVGLARGPDLKNCKSVVGSLHNIKHTPSGSAITIPNERLQWNVTSKVGSLDNIKHRPGGGQLKVQSRKLEWKVNESKVQSLQNIRHKPGGGNVKIFNDSYAALKPQPAARQTPAASSPGAPPSSAPAANSNAGDQAAEQLQRLKLSSKQ